MAKGGFFKDSKRKEDTDPISGPLATVSTGNEIAGIASGVRPKLKIWDKFGLSREMSALTRQKLGEISAAIVEAQKQEIVQSLMLSLDLSKKKRFSEYLDRVGLLNGDIVRRSQAMERDLVETLSLEVEKIYEDKRKWDSRIEEMKSKGLLSQRDYDSEQERKNKWVDIMKDNLDAKIELVMRNHATSLQTTLELLKDKSIRGEDALG